MVTALSGSFSGTPPEIIYPGSGTFDVKFNGQLIAWTLKSYEGNQLKTSMADASASTCRCGDGCESENDNDKVAVCHRPNGSQSEAHTLYVDFNAVQAHLNHGDYLGSCYIEEKAATGEGIDGLFAYPNPTSGLVTLTIDGDAQNARISVIDVLGMEYPLSVVNVKNNGQLEIDISNLADGLYLLRVSTSGGEKTLPLLKQ